MCSQQPHPTPLSKEYFGYYFNPKETIFDFYHLKMPELAKDFCSPTIKTNPRIFKVLVNKIFTCAKLNGNKYFSHLFITPTQHSGFQLILRDIFSKIRANSKFLASYFNALTCLQPKVYNCGGF